MTVTPTPITTLLVANRGEIARRVFRTAHRMGIRCVAVYVDADADAPHVADADEAVRLATSYLDATAIVDAATAVGAGAIHPGYGFLAENAAFARLAIDAGLIWVGPTPEVIAQMGDKIAAKAVAEAAGVPTLASSDDPTRAADVGYPILVKAAAGGGGKGMRVVDHPDDLEAAIAAARREAASAFGDDRVFIERFVPRSRHVEIQILGDQHGTLLHLGERECSIQRRHQKIIEESPSPAVDDALREQMGAAALRLAGALGYVSAGTVEFLVDDDTKEFSFLEVNTRLQVEHPVTEEVTGIDLVREQLRIASGEPLGYRQDDISFSGHAIEARLYAEDPGAGFLPATGTLAAYQPAAEPAVRWDAGVEQGSVIGVDFDPMIAKVVAHAPSRAEAAGRLALALERLHIGGVTTNRDFLAATLRDPSFLAGDTTTDFIERVQPATEWRPSGEHLDWLRNAAALWIQGRNRADAPVWGEAPSGWRNARLPDQYVTLKHHDTEHVVAYAANRDGSFSIGDETARVHDWGSRSIDVEIGDRRESVAIALQARRGPAQPHDRLFVQTHRGTVTFEVLPRFTVPGNEVAGGGFVAPMPGVVLELRVSAGDPVRAGQTLIVLEAMKMEHHMNAPEDGVVAEVYVREGDQVEFGAQLLAFEAAADPDGAESAR